MNETGRNHMKDLKPILAAQPFFRGMKSEHLDVLVRHAREVQFEPGQVIFRQGEAAFEFFLLSEGEVAIESYVPRADNVSLQTVGAGDVLGWSWLFPPFSWHFQARAVTRTKAILVDGARLLIACERDADLGYELMQRVAQVVIDRLQSARKGLANLYRDDGALPALDDTPFRQHSPTAQTADLLLMLAEHPFFKGIKPEYLKILSRSAMETKFEADQAVFKEGEPANRFYLIQHGKVILESPKSQSSAIPIQIISDGDVLGWSWLFPPFYWHFDARALESTTSIFLYGARLREECETNHAFGYDLLKRVCQVLIGRLQATRRQLLRLHARRSQPSLLTH
jgi:CRP/FNR family transcriptional regulator, cyclic AMP receptor protein